jgi:hypothetical protein
LISNIDVAVRSQVNGPSGLDRLSQDQFLRHPDLRIRFTFSRTKPSPLGSVPARNMKLASCVSRDDMPGHCAAVDHRAAEAALPAVRHLRRHFAARVPASNISTPWRRW